MKRLFLIRMLLLIFLPIENHMKRQLGGSLHSRSKKRLKIYCSAISYNNIYYLIRQTQTHIPTVKLLDELSNMTEIISVDEKIISQSLNLISGTLKTRFNTFVPSVWMEWKESLPGIRKIFLKAVCQY